MIRLALALLSFLVVETAIAQDASKLVGSWRLVSWQYEFQDGSPTRAVFGNAPIGYVVFTPGGRMAGIIEAEGRKTPQTDAEAAAAFRTMVSYSGTYRVEGDKWITKVDAAWNPAWRGTDQVRQYKLEGNRLHVISMWQPNPNLPGKPVTRGILSWEREN